MKQYLLILLLSFMSVSIIIYGFMTFIYASFNPAIFDIPAKIFALVVTIIITGVLTEKLNDL